MSKEGFVDTGVKSEALLLPEEVREGYRKYAKLTWNSICAMDYPETGLPADHLHYYETKTGRPTEENYRTDKTSPTNIGFFLASISAATAMGFISLSEARQRIGRTLETIESIIRDPEVFIKTSEDKGLMVNWIQPSTGKVLKQWPDNKSPVKQQLSSVDNAWLIAFSQLTSAYFPEFSHPIQTYLNRIDLPFMFDKNTGFFHGCYVLNPPGFEKWSYDVISEARIAYLVCGDNIAEFMGNLTNRRSERSVFTDSKNRRARATWDGQFFQLGWPRLLVPEDKLNGQWRDTYRGTIQAHRDFGHQYNGGHYGYSAGLGPDGQYHEFRVPELGENTVPYQRQPVITISALLNMGLEEPVETYQALQQIHQEFPDLVHPNNGDGDTVNTMTGAVQRGQLLPNQATNLLACWNIIKDCQPQDLFMGTVPPSIKDIYRHSRLW